MEFSISYILNILQVRTFVFHARTHAIQYISSFHDIYKLKQRRLSCIAFSLEKSQHRERNYNVQYNHMISGLGILENKTKKHIIYIYILFFIF